MEPFLAPPHQYIVFHQVVDKSMHKAEKLLGSRYDLDTSTQEIKLE